MKPTNNHIEEYFVENTNNATAITSRALFDAKKEDVDIKTDLQHREITLIASLKEFDTQIKKHSLKPIYENFLLNYEKLKISMDRKSRMEFVDMHRAKDTTNDVLNTMSNISNVAGAKK